MTGDFVLPESVTELGNFIVSGSAFNGKLDIKANIEEIPAYAFKDTKFTSLALPNSLKKIGEQAFYGCASLTSSITFGNKLEIVDKYAFSKSGIAGALVFPTSLKKIGTFAFAECPNITGITLPLISYGGSSILSYFISFAIILNISPATKRTIHLNRSRKKSI